MNALPAQDDSEPVSYTHLDVYKRQALLYFALFPPAQPIAAGTLAVLTADAAASTPGEQRIALPEAPANNGAQPMPDLATALRLHPGTRRLHVVGAGLEARDIEAARGIPALFSASPAPVGLVELQADTCLLYTSRCV